MFIVRKWQVYLKLEKLVDFSNDDKVSLQPLLIICRRFFAAFDQSIVEMTVIKAIHQAGCSRFCLHQTIQTLNGPHIGSLDKIICTRKCCFHNWPSSATETFMWMHLWIIHETWNWSQKLKGWTSRKRLVVVENGRPSLLESTYPISCNTTWYYPLVVLEHDISTILPDDVRGAEELYSGQINVIVLLRSGVLCAHVQWSHIWNFMACNQWFILVLDLIMFSYFPFTKVTQQQFICTQHIPQIIIW